MSDDFVAFVCEQLGGVTSRRMFGAWGLYDGDTIIGIVHDERVYAKVWDDAHRDRFVAAGCEPFRPRPTQKLGSYWEVPADAVDNADALRNWFARSR